jgi:5-methylthioadenosine/S-adenosylhomocysteine deaminase
MGNARTAGLDKDLGAIRPGFKADLVLIDLKDLAYLPYNSAARQLVYTESGRGVDTVIVDGKVVIKDRKMLTIDEDALRREVADLMRSFNADFDKVVQSRKQALPYMLEAHRRAWQPDLEMHRFIARTR